MEPVTDSHEAPASEAAIFDIAEERKQRSLSSREGKLKQLEQAHDDFFRAHVETRRLLRTEYKWIDEDGVPRTETIPALSGGSHGGDCLSVETNAKSIRPRLVALEIAMNKIERAMFAMKCNQWHLAPKYPAAFIDSLRATIPPVAGDVPLPPAAEAPTEAKQVEE